MNVRRQQWMLIPGDNIQRLKTTENACTYSFVEVSGIKQSIHATLNCRVELDKLETIREVLLGIWIAACGSKNLFYHFSEKFQQEHFKANKFQK